MPPVSQSGSRSEDGTRGIIPRRGELTMTRPTMNMLKLGIIAFGLVTPVAVACCPVPPSGKPVLNADQTVVMIWDAANKTQHFVRQASFRSEADDFGFLIPTPSKPELEESSNEAFSFLHKLTE